MFAIHYYENKVYVFNHATEIVPSVDETIRIKGRNGKVLNVEQKGEQKYFVFIEFEKVIDKSKIDPRDSKKKRR